MEAINGGIVQDQPKLITINILSDVVCPWCVIGYYRLRSAIERLSLEDRTVIRWHPFELNPSMSEQGENLRDHLAAKYGTTLNGSIQARKRLTELGHEVGFQFNYFDDMRMWNTRNAHLLLNWAETTGRQTDLKEALFKAYFSEQKDISSSDVLLNLLDQLQLDRAAAEETLQSSSALSSLIEMERKWLSGGFHGVPVVIINGDEILQGAQEIETYCQALIEAD